MTAHRNGNMSKHFINSDWTNYPPYLRKAYKVIDVEKDLHDVTLVCDDGAVDAHKLILCSASIFFRLMLKRSKHQHPLLYMKGLKINQIQNILDYIYYGQVSIAKENLKEFIDIAKEFEVESLKSMTSKERLGGTQSVGHKTPDHKNIDETEIIVIESNEECEEEIKEEIKEETCEEIFVIEPELVIDETVPDESSLKSTRNTIEENFLSDHSYSLATICISETETNLTMEHKPIMIHEETPEPSIMIHEETTEPTKIIYGETIEPSKMIHDEITKPRKMINKELSEPNIMMHEETTKANKMIHEETEIQVGAYFLSKEEVQDAVDRLSDASLTRFVCSSNSTRTNGTGTKRKIQYTCCFGNLRNSKSKGIRQSSSKYVGCPARVRFNQQNDGLFLVVRADLEHKEHDVSEELYAKMRKRLSKDQEEVIRALLETNHSYADIAQFLRELTGKVYSTKEVGYFKRRLINKSTLV